MMPILEYRQEIQKLLEPLPAEIYNDDDRAFIAKITQPWTPGDKHSNIKSICDVIARIHENVIENFGDMRRTEMAAIRLQDIQTMLLIEIIRILQNTALFCSESKIRDIQILTSHVDDVINAMQNNTMPEKDRIQLMGHIEKNLTEVADSNQHEKPDYGPSMLEWAIKDIKTAIALYTSIIPA